MKNIISPRLVILLIFLAMFLYVLSLALGDDTSG